MPRKVAGPTNNIERFEFDLHQGWTKGLRICFEDAQHSDAFNAKVALHVEQVHGRDIHFVTSEDMAKVSPIAKADGLFVQGDEFKSSKRPLLIKTADCIPLVLVDRESESLALIHAGWRGLQQGIHTRLIDEGHFEIEKTWAWIGPSLSGENFEVREDMWSQFEEQNDPEIFAPTSDPSIRHFHPWVLLQKTYEQMGLEVIYNCEENTYENKAFYSHRRSTQKGEERKGSNYTWVRFY